MAASVSQRIIVEQAELNERQSTGRMALFRADGTPFGGGASALPATATAAELQAGTETGLRMVSPKLIHDEVARQIAAIPA